MYYSGIGPRQTQPGVLDLMERIASRLAGEGWVLRSGHAKGADQAFERGADGRAEIYLPWINFQGDVEVSGDVLLPSEEAYELAARHHPAWSHLSRGARALHARNSHQVLGRDLVSPSAFIVCWTANDRGGTQQALRIARAYDVAIYDLRDDELVRRVRSWLG